MLSHYEDRTEINSATSNAGSNRKRNREQIVLSHSDSSDDCISYPLLPISNSLSSTGCVLTAFKPIPIRHMTPGTPVSSQTNQALMTSVTNQINKVLEGKDAIISQLLSENSELQGLNVNALIAENNSLRLTQFQQAERIQELEQELNQLRTCHIDPFIISGMPSLFSPVSSMPFFSARTPQLSLEPEGYSDLLTSNPLL